MMKTSGAPMRRRCRRWKPGRPGLRSLGAIRESGRYGNVVPGPAAQIDGASCRQYTHTVYIDGRPQVERGTACRNPDGTWTIVS